jgi:hypothetical protein
LGHTWESKSSPTLSKTSSLNRLEVFLYPDFL